MIGFVPLFEGDKKSKGQRKRGGQRGHQGAHWELFAREKVNKPVDLYACWNPLPRVPDLTPKRYQQTEVPPIEPYTTEWRRHAVRCPDCGYGTHAAYDEATIPASPFGPRLMVIVPGQTRAALVGTARLSRPRA